MAGKVIAMIAQNSKRRVVGSKVWERSRWCMTPLCTIRPRVACKLMVCVAEYGCTKLSHIVRVLFFFRLFVRPNLAKLPISQYGVSYTSTYVIQFYTALNVFSMHERPHCRSQYGHWSRWRRRLQRARVAVPRTHFVNGRLGLLRLNLTITRLNNNLKF